MKNSSYYILIMSIMFLTSCSKQLSDNELSGQLLMGPFTTTALSGNVVNQELDALSEVSDDKLIAAYKDIFALPYTPQVEEQAKAVLLNDYNATDKISSEAAIKKLVTDSKTSDFKAYPYARAVNVANLAYSAGFFSKLDLGIYEQNVLNEAKSNYSDWNAYLKDFLKGREKNMKQDPNNSQQLFEIIVNEILLKHKNSPYLNLGFASK